MSEIKYGLISQTDARVLEYTIDLICDEFKDEIIKVTEIGIYSGQTSKGIWDYVLDNKKRLLNLKGIDNKKDGEEIIYFPINPYTELIIGNSNEVYNQLPDEGQHLIFIDGCHCFAHVVSDFFCYAPKVKKGAYLAFHDTGKHIAKFKDFQHGDKENPDAYISVRKALEKIGLFELHEYPMMKDWIGNFGFELIFDEADETNPAGGICVFKKLY